MKKTNFISGLLLLICFIVTSSFTAVKIQKEAEYEKGYFYLIISGSSTKGTSIISNALLYESRNQCGDKKYYEFQSKARLAFSKYLKANYPDADPYSANVQVLEESTSEGFVTKQDARDAFNKWKATQIERGYKFLDTNFTYDCE